MRKNGSSNSTRLNAVDDPTALLPKSQDSFRAAIFCCSPTTDNLSGTAPPRHLFGLNIRVMMTSLRVGAAQVAFEEAKVWATEYLVGRPGASAYPAYDGYPGSDSDLIAPQDLLAVALLNVSNKPLKVYYGLQSQLELLNEGLQSPDLKGSLCDASAATLEAIADLFGVLEEKRADNVKLTTLSKVLHRKRPELLPSSMPRSATATPIVSALPSLPRRSGARGITGWLGWKRSNMI